VPQIGFALNQLLDRTNTRTLFNADGSHMQQLATVGAQIVRLDISLNHAVGWDDAMLGLYAGVVEMLSEAGLSVIGLLSHAIVPGAAPLLWNAPAGQDGTNQFIRDYVAAAHRIVPALPRVTHWEVWNEPNNSGSPPTRIDASLYASLLARAHGAIKALSPQSAVITGGILAFNPDDTCSRAYSGADYLQDVWHALSQAGLSGNLPFDAVGIHMYLDPGGPLNPAHLQGYLNTYYAVIDANMGRRVAHPLPLYITEAGWSTDIDDPKYAGGAVDAETQAANLAALLQVCANNGFVAQDRSDSDAVAPYVAAVCCFDLSCGVRGFGAFDKTGAEKPAVAAIQAFTNAPTGAAAMLAPTASI